jgi:hypothetical protein
MHPWTFSYDPWTVPRRRYQRVGGTTAGGLLELSRQGIETTDAVVQDLDIPVMSNALDLMDDVFTIADDLGIGSQVRQAVYGLRGAEYATSVISSTPLGVSTAATAAYAGENVLTGLGGMAALGAIGLVIGIVALLDPFGDDDAEKKRAKKAQAEVLHLRDRLTLQDFASEQDGAAGGLTMMASFAAAVPNVGDPAELQKRALFAQKLAQFYRAADKTLDPQKRDLFESLSNLARWQQSIVSYSNLGTAQRDNIDVQFGKSAPRLPYQLGQPMKAETVRLTNLMKGQGQSSGGGGGAVLLVGLAGLAAVGAYAAASPSGALAAAKTGLAGAKHAGSAAIATGKFAWKVGQGAVKTVKGIGR